MRGEVAELKKQVEKKPEAATTKETDRGGKLDSYKIVSTFGNSGQQTEGRKGAPSNNLRPKGPR